MTIGNFFFTYLLSALLGRVLLYAIALMTIRSFDESLGLLHATVIILAGNADSDLLSKSGFVSKNVL